MARETEVDKHQSRLVVLYLFFCASFSEPDAQQKKINKESQILYKVRVDHQTFSSSHKQRLTKRLLSFYS